MAVFRVERNRGYTVMSNHHLQNRKLTLKAKGLLSQMLSLPEDWDYTLRGLAYINKESIDAIRTAVLELEAEGYIVRQQSRDPVTGKMNKIEYTIYEQPQAKKEQKGEDAPRLENPNAAETPCLDFPNTGFPNTDKPDTEEPNTGNPTQINKKRKNKEKEITEESSIHPSIKKTLPGSDESVMAAIEVYRDIIKDNIEYEALCQTYGEERMEGILELMVETVCSPRKTIRIGGQDYVGEVVKSRLLKLNQFHLEYVLNCLDNHTGKIHNIRSYLLTSLYNAPTTIDQYYKSEVQHDLYGV